MSTTSAVFEIEPEWLGGLEGDPADRGCFAEIAIRVDHNVLTVLEDAFARTIRPGVRASAYDLALWLAGNWWRLRWEPENRPSLDWRLSHVLAAAGNGVAWPNITFTSDGLHVLVEARRTHGTGEAPVRYLQDADLWLSAAAFEAAIDDFVERVLARLSALRIAPEELAGLWREVREERDDEALANDRRLEAMLGFDPHEAPEGLLAKLCEGAQEAGRAAVEEIAAAARDRASEVLGAMLERARSSPARMRLDSVAPVASAYRARFPSQAPDLPWRRARFAARSARHALQIDAGPISNGQLSERLDLGADLLETAEPARAPLGAALRFKGAADVANVVLRAKVRTGRRFELMRLVADGILACEDDQLLPATSAKTDRQKFQRAFAQEFLLPFEELSGQLDLGARSEEEIGDDEIDEIAQVYDVSPLLVQTTLVNRGLLPREVLPASHPGPA